MDVDDFVSHCGHPECIEAVRAKAWQLDILRQALSVAARMPANPVYTAQQMASFDKKLLDQLRAEGATRVVFHESGALASVEYGPLVAPYAGEGQHDVTSAPKGNGYPPAPGGRLVPRAIPPRE